MCYDVPFCCFTVTSTNTAIWSQELDLTSTNNSPSSFITFIYFSIQSIFIILRDFVKFICLNKNWWQYRYDESINQKEIFSMIIFLLRTLSDGLECQDPTSINLVSLILQSIHIKSNNKLNDVLLGISFKEFNLISNEKIIVTMTGTT